jgi:hypothetical protein
VLTERARQWAFEQVGEQDAAVARVAAELGVAWWTVMDRVIDRGTPVIDDSARLAPAGRPVTAVGVDETAYLRATATHATTFATGIADLSPGRPARLLDVVEGRSGSALAEWLTERDPAWPGRGDDRVAGPVPRLRHRPDQPAPGRGTGARPVPRRAVGPGLRGRRPTPRPARHDRAPRPQPRSGLRHPASPAPPPHPG